MQVKYVTVSIKFTFSGNWRKLAMYIDNFVVGETSLIETIISGCTDEDATNYNPSH